MATESMQMAAPGPAASVFPQLVGYEVPEDFGGCGCRNSKCVDANCACFKLKYRCTIKCRCRQCANEYGIRGSDSNIQQKKAISRPAAHVLIGLEVPEGFMGCKCNSTQCDSGKCVCLRGKHRCTSKCRCRSCFNRYGTRSSGSSTEPGQGGTGGASNIPDDTTPPTNIEPQQADDTSGIAGEPPQVQDQSRGSKDFDLNQLPSSNTEQGQADGDSSTELGQGGTAGASNVPDETTPAPNTETEHADDTSGMATEPPQVQDQSRGSKDFDLNQVPSPNTEQGQADGDSTTEPGQVGTAGASNVPDETTPALNIETEQADDTSGMAREPPQVEEQSRGNRGFDLNEVPSSNI